MLLNILYIFYDCRLAWEAILTASVIHGYLAAEVQVEEQCAATALSGVANVLMLASRGR